jgi:c-di-GMP-binding flagellar brake protein YcgR
MMDDRRHFLRCGTRGVVLIYDKKLETAYLQDISLGGMKVSSKASLLYPKTLWVEFTLIQANNEMIFGKRAEVNLVYSKFNHATRRHILGFHFLNLTEFQCNVINSILSSEPSQANYF